jgi:hypothetical protein
VCWPTAATLTFAVGAALTVALPEPARRSLVGAFAAGEMLFAAGIVLMVVGVAIQAWQRPVGLRSPRRWLSHLADGAARCNLVLLGLALNAAGAFLHPAAVLLAGRLDGSRDTSLLLADVAAVLLVYTPLALLVLGRRRTARPAWPAA